LTKGEKAELLVQRSKLVQRYEALKGEMDSVRAALRNLPLIGHYVPNAVLYLCDRCDEGPFNAHEIRLHKPKCKGKK
jgi:hypothetical protein